MQKQHVNSLGAELSRVSFVGDFMIDMTMKIVVRNTFFFRSFYAILLYFCVYQIIYLGWIW